MQPWRFFLSCVAISMVAGWFMFMTSGLLEKAHTTATLMMIIGSLIGGVVIMKTHRTAMIVFISMCCFMIAALGNIWYVTAAGLFLLAFACFIDYTLQGR
jgi:hypothetical protein